MILNVIYLFQLYNVIVDTELTSKLLLQHGQLQHRTTFIPLNKIASRGLDTRVIQVAQQLVRNGVIALLSHSLMYVFILN